MAEKGECIAKVKFWFGAKEDIFNKALIVEIHEDFAYIYKPKK